MSSRRQRQRRRRKSEKKTFSLAQFLSALIFLLPALLSKKLRRVIIRHRTELRLALSYLSLSSSFFCLLIFRTLLHPSEAFSLLRIGNLLELESTMCHTISFEIVFVSASHTQLNLLVLIMF